MGRVTIDQFRQSVTERVGRVKKWAAFEIEGRLTRKTPVDTGRARASWNIAVGAADLSVAPEAEPGGSVPPHAPQAIGFIPLGVPVIVSNNLPYIVPLNQGHSRQAPAGFVEATLDEVVNASEGAVTRIRREAEARG